MAWRDSTAAVEEFVRERDWAQFHSPENLAKSVAIEAGELLECYQWSAESDPDAVRQELADVFIYGLLLARRLDLDVDEIISAKLRANAVKYPVERSKGKSLKYDRL